MSISYVIEKFFYNKNRSVPVFREYDKRRGFDAWADACRAVAKRGPADPAKNILGNQGFAHVKLMSKAEAKKIRTAADVADGAVEDRKNAGYSQTLKASDPAFLKSVVERLITPEVDEMLYNYFGSEFCPYWYHFSRALPNKEPKRAFLWHCDKGPSMHAKMLFYMTSVEDTGGNTYLLDRPTTIKFDKAGYVFGGQKDRQDDLSEFAAKNNIDCKPVSFDMQPGEAIMFLPQKVLHRGLLPNKLPRFIMQVTFVPSKLHWKEVLKNRATGKVSQSAEDYAWPEHARELGVHA